MRQSRAWRRLAAGGIVAGLLVPALGPSPARAAPPGTVTGLDTIRTVAGTGLTGYTGDGGPAAQAEFNGAGSVAYDSAGNLYIVDAGNFRVRKVDTSGTITTVAGNGVEGYSGDGGPATAAALADPAGVALDSDGNLYVAERGFSTIPGRVRRVDPSGIISTFAGGGSPADGVGDGGSATAAILQQPEGLTVDGRGNLYIACFDGRVRKVDRYGTISTWAGGGPRGNAIYPGEPATSVAIGVLSDVAIDRAGTMYLGGGGVTKIDASGNFAPFQTTGAKIGSACGLAVDEAGDLYVADCGNQPRVLKVDASYNVTVVAGNGTAGTSGDGGPAQLAQLAHPYGLAFDAGGALAMTDSNRVRRISDPTLVAVTGSDGAMYANRDGQGFTTLGGSLSAAPAVVAVPVNQGLPSPLYLGVGPDRDVYVRSDTQGWQPVSTSPVACLDSPAATVTGAAGASTLTVACQGSDHALYVAQGAVTTAALPLLPAWQSLGGSLTAGPAVASVQGTLTFMVTSSGGQVYARTLLSGFTATGWACSGRPALASQGSVSYFACHGAGDALWYALDLGSGWSALLSAGSSIADGPSIAAGVTQVSIVVQGSDGAVYRVALPPGGGPLSGFVAAGGSVRGGVGATALVPS